MRKIIPIFLLLLMFSCTKDFKKINTDPDSFSTIQPEYIFNGVVKRTIDLMADMNKNTCWSYSHYLSIEGGSFPRYSATPVSMNGWWNRFYIDILSNLNQIKVMYGNDPAYANRIQMVKIWESYIYSIMVATWGPVPYSEAFNLSLKKYKYDSEPEIYTGILNTLKTATESLNEQGDFFTPDKIFTGSNQGAVIIKSWKKFANSLRLKIALRISDVNPTLAQPHILAVMTDENMLVSGKNDEVKAYWGVELENYSPYYFSYNPNYNPVSPGTYAFLSNFMFMYLRSYNDPRLTKFASPSVIPYVVADTIWVKDIHALPKPGLNDTVAYLIQYPIDYFGKPKTGRIPASWNFTGQLPLPESDYQYAPINYSFLTPDYFHMIVSYADVCFMKAEAALKGWGGSKSAEDYYYDGIKASYDQYGLSSAAYTKYISGNGIKWGTSATGYEDFCGIVNASINGEPMVQIATQRWIANYFHGGHDAWCLQRRLKFLDLPPHFNPETPTTTNALAADLPERLPYPEVEINLNSSEVQNAINTYFGGQNTMTGMLYFSKKHTYPEWLKMIPRINNDIVQYFYGKTFASLDSSGVQYQIIKAIKFRSIH